MAYTEIGRIRPRMRGAHSTSASYLVMDLVRNSGGTIAYMAVKDVPAGIALTNTEYWVVFADVSSLRGPQGEVGPAFTFEDFTAEELESLRGPQGEPFTYEDFTEEQLAELKGPKGDKGDGVKILGSFDSLSDLELAHPAGSPGDAYMIGGNLYVWDDYNGWTDAGAINTVQVSETQPNAQVWIDTSEEGVVNVPQVNDETVSVYDTWSSSKIADYVSNEFLGGAW